jgi:hypothetical protein
MFTYGSVKRTGRSRKATGTGSFARIKLCHESLESRRLLAGNNPWEVSLSPGDDISSLSDISISAIGDFSSANSISAVGDFTEPPGSNYFAGNSTEAEQQDVVDSVANGILSSPSDHCSQCSNVVDTVAHGILSRLDALLSNPGPVPPELAPVPPAAMTWVGTVTNPIIDSFDIGWGVTPADATDCAIDLSGSDDDPLVAIGFGEAVDDVTLAVNDYCSQQILDLANSLELLPGQIVAAIWFDPINFTVSIGGQEVSYDYDNNPTAIVGNIPGASLVVTAAGQFTPGGVQAIIFTGNSSTIDIQMTTTNSGELMRGGVNIYTVTAGINGTTIQPTIRTVFQGYLQRDTIVMSFDPSQPSFVRAGVAAGSVSVASLPSAIRAVGSGAGGGIPIGIAGNSPSPDLLVFAFLDPTALANSGLDISGTIAVSEDQDGEVDGLNEMPDQLGADDLDTDTDDGDEDDVSGEDRDGLDAGEFELEEDDLPDEEQLDEAISVMFNLIGESLASNSGQVNVPEILKNDRESTPKKEQPDASQRHQHWETYSTEFLAKPIDRLNPESLARVEPAGQNRFLDT